MAITGIAKVIYGVDDLSNCTKFYKDFGLELIQTDDQKSILGVEEGATVILYKMDNPVLAPAYFEGPGVREVIWGVDTQENLEKLERELSRDRDVRKDEYGVLHFITDCGIPTGLMVFNPKPVVSAPDSINAPGNIKRFNQVRKWRARAYPKKIQHVVFIVTDLEKSWAFFRDRLKFRLSDVSRGLGIFARADGRNEHHNVFFQKAGAIPGADKAAFDHLNFGVEDIDEMMVGANYMERNGWRMTRERLGGFGRHRISSALFCYIDCPCGGKAEYGADTDYLDDSWVPREWEPLFGSFAWTSEIPPYIKKEPVWDMKFIQASEETEEPE